MGTWIWKIAHSMSTTVPKAEMIQADMCSYSQPPDLRKPALASHPTRLLRCHPHFLRRNHGRQGWSGTERISNWSYPDL